MAKLCLKKKSKRIPAKRRYRVEKKVRDHNRKVKRDAKKQVKAGGKRKKKPIISVPNNCPFKDEILKEVGELKKKKEEERQKQKAIWKKEREEMKKLEKESQSLEGLVAKAEAKQKLHEAFEKEPEEKSILVKREGSVKAYYKEFKKVVEAADVILEVVDARDPLGTRCKQVEQAVMDSGGNKRLVIVVNKADLIPRKNLDDWLKYLRGSFPTVPFKASTQSQARKLGRRKMPKGKSKNIPDTIQFSSCVGAELLMSLLGNYCRNKGVKTGIKVGIVGLPNVGKSSIINSLKRSRACNVGAVPGVTKTMQEVQLDSKIKLLDSPGLVFASSSGGGNEALIALKNAAKVESLADPFPPAIAILQRTTKQQMMEQYDIGEYNSPEEFFALKAQRQGKFKKGGTVDVEAAARGLIDDWNKGKIRYYTIPPEVTESHVSSEIVKEMSKEFDIDKLETMETDMLSGLENPTSGPSFRVETTGITEARPMDDDDDGMFGSNLIVPESKRMKLKRKNPPLEVDDTAGLLPLSNKKLQKIQKKKEKKEMRRKEKKSAALSASLADELSGFSISDNKSEAYSFETDFNPPP